MANFETQRPFYVRIGIGNHIPQQNGETRQHYCRKAANFARKLFGILQQSPNYRHAHSSFALRDALLATECKFTDLGTFGVEHISAGHNQRSPAIEYLNTGDAYSTTVLVVRGRFVVGCWGDIVERGSYA